MRVTTSRPVERGESIRWRRLDTFGAFNGEFFGSIDGLTTHLLEAKALDRSLWDIADVTVTHHKEIYLCDAGALVECTMVTLRTPWGDERFVPADLGRY